MPDETPTSYMETSNWCQSCSRMSIR